MKDVTILYQGGSGGFALYYYLLLSGRYQFDIGRLDQMIKQQFPQVLATAPSLWKIQEFWPDNQDLRNQPGRKLFLICNPLFDSGSIDANKSLVQNTYKILLYTDIHLQIRLAYEKRAYWFTDVSRWAFDAPADIKKYLRSIISSRVKFNGIDVDPMIPKIIQEFHPDRLLSLDDFLVNGFDETDPPNQRQIDFLEYWLSIQPKKSRLSGLERQRIIL